MRSLSEVILEVVANPRVVMFRAEDSLFENMSWSETENGRFDCPNVCHPAIIIIDDIHVAGKPRSSPQSSIVLPYSISFDQIAPSRRYHIDLRLVILACGHPDMWLEPCVRC